MKQCHIAVFAENADTILSVFNPAVYERLFPGSRLSVQLPLGKPHPVNSRRDPHPRGLHAYSIGDI